MPKGESAVHHRHEDFSVFMDGAESEPSYVLEGREKALSPVFADPEPVRRDDARFNGQSTVGPNGNTASG